MGVKLFTQTGFDTSFCAAACSAQSQYNTAHPPQDRPAQTCQFYNTYALYKNDMYQGQYWYASRLHVALISTNINTALSTTRDGIRLLLPTLVNGVAAITTPSRTVTLPPTHRTRESVPQLTHRLRLRLLLNRRTISHQYRPSMNRPGTTLGYQWPTSSLCRVASAP